MVEDSRASARRRCFLWLPSFYFSRYRLVIGCSDDIFVGDEEIMILLALATSVFRAAIPMGVLNFDRGFSSVGWDAVLSCDTFLLFLYRCRCRRCHCHLVFSFLRRFSRPLSFVPCSVDGVVGTKDDDDSCWDWRWWWCCVALVLSVASINFGGSDPPHRKRFSLSTAALWQFLQMSSSAPFLFLGPNFFFAVASLFLSSPSFFAPVVIRCVYDVALSFAHAVFCVWICGDITESPAG